MYRKKGGKIRELTEVKKSTNEEEEASAMAYSTQEDDEEDRVSKNALGGNRKRESK